MSASVLPLNSAGRSSGVAYSLSLPKTPCRSGSPHGVRGGVYGLSAVRGACAATATTRHVAETTNPTPALRRIESTRRISSPSLRTGLSAVASAKADAFYYCARRRLASWRQIRDNTDESHDPAGSPDGNRRRSLLARPRERGQVLHGRGQGPARSRKARACPRRASHSLCDCRRDGLE